MKPTMKRLLCTISAMSNNDFEMDMHIKCYGSTEEDVNDAKPRRGRAKEN